MMKIEQENKDKKGRFIVYDNEEFAGEMTYTWAGTNKFIIEHTGVEDKFGGKGYGKKMVMKAVELARAQDLKILPRCPFAKKVFDKDESIQDVKY